MPNLREFLNNNSMIATRAGSSRPQVSCSVR